jgi:RsiW-degrading membrane proteinase PrsW (M82 family)
MRLLIAITVLPVVLILDYIYRNDVHKEEKSHLRKTILLGILFLIPVAIIELIVDVFFPVESTAVTSYVQLFINTFLGIAIIEEGGKYLVVRLFNYNKNHFDESYDAIVYCTYASLGFAVAENVLYVFGGLFTSGSTISFITAIFRALTSIPGHACFGIFMGYFVAKAKMAQFNNEPGEKKYLLLALFTATIVHTIYDFLLLSGNDLFKILWFVFIIVCDVIAIRFIKNGAKENVVFSREQNQPINGYGVNNSPYGTGYTNFGANNNVYSGTGNPVINTKQGGINNQGYNQSVNDDGGGRFN